MGEFSLEWLTLREPYDARARSEQINDALLQWCKSHQRPEVCDLGAGSGANFRYLSSRIGSASWSLYDHDASLLAAVATTERGLMPKTQTLDLAKHLPALPVDGLLTASALLDLVSERWLATLVANSTRARCAALFVLNYDGAVRFAPSHALDARVIDWVNTHQRGDKGFGSALGPRAGARAVTLWREAGYEVMQAQSDWQIAAQDMQLALLSGWRDAALEIAPESAQTLFEWAACRQAWIEEGVSRIEVGHLDLFAVPSLNV